MTSVAESVTSSSVVVVAGLMILMRGQHSESLTAT